jgi:hypothetical protein
VYPSKRRKNHFMSDTKTQPSDESPKKMSKEDIAYFIKTIWTALLKPDWERSDLIDLGMAVFIKTPLSRLDAKKFEKLFPYLTIVAEDLASHLSAFMMKAFEEYLKAHHNASPEAEILGPKVDLLAEASTSPEAKTSSLQAEAPAVKEENNG